MADVEAPATSRKNKIAAARKKLKQFKEKGKISSNQSNSDNRSSSTRSSVSPSSNPSITEEKPSIQDPPSPEVVNFHVEQSRPTASTESLHQLSQHINDLLNESSAAINGEIPVAKSSISQLEKRNRELAALLAKHTEVNEQLHAQVQQLRSQSQNLREELDGERQTFEDKQKRDVGSLKEQLQVHIQTIGILVAEKTELQSKINQLQKISDQRLDEIEDMNSRVRVSKQRITELERSMTSLNTSSQQYEKTSKEYAKDIDRLKLELYKSNQTTEELRQQTSELTEKLNSKISECLAQDQNFEELKKKLEMSELYAQQLSSQSDQESVKLLETLQAEKEELTNKVLHYQESFQSVTDERNQLSEQYQQYIEQLQQQNQSLTGQVTSLTGERESLLSKQHEQETEMGSLRKQLEEAESQSATNSTASLQLEIEKLHSDYEELSKRHEAQIRDNAQMSRLLEEKEDKIMELDFKIAQLGQEAGDKAQLLENIQSDKTALSRALTQNKDLKHQLAELQNGFVKMSNDSMELMTKLQTEEYRSHELAQRLGQQEDELKDMRDALMSRDSQLTEIKKNADSVQKENYQQEQIQDRLRHYESQAQLVETLQRELTASQDMMEALTTQNSELRNMLVKSQGNKDVYDTTPTDERDHIMDSLQATIRQLEAERNQLMENLKNQRNFSDDLTVKVADLQEQVSMSTNPEENIVSRTEFEKLKKTMDLIQEKYTRAMRDKADLSDKADQLEHLVLQLQGETDTIGEYISLYHHQRALLQQREFQKNDYISRLAKDREDLQGKLSKLQGLVVQMFGERGVDAKSVLAQTNAYHMYHNCHEEEKAGHEDPHFPAPMVNGEGKYPEDWPDYSSSNSSESLVEAIVGGETTLEGDEQTTDLPPPPPPPDSLTEQQQQLNTSSSSSVPPPPTTIDNEIPLHMENNQTAKRIMDLFSEIDSNLCDTVPFNRKFLPCKYCKGSVKDL